MDSGSYLAISGTKVHLLIHSETSGESSLALATQSLHELANFIAEETKADSQTPHAPTAQQSSSSSSVSPAPAQPSNPASNTGERVHLASLAGIAAADRFLGRRSDPIQKATNLQNRIYLIARDKHSNQYIPLKRLSTWAETATLVEISRGKPGEVAIFQGFPARFEADAFEFSFTTHLASLKALQ